MAEKVQNYKNHARLYPLFHLFVAPVLAANVVVAGRRLYWAQNLHFAWELLIAITLVALALSARLMALAVQDRVIRLEMRLRLHQLLAGDAKMRINDLTPRQLVALRFASDAELPTLVNEVLAGKLASSKEIKMRVKNWEGDWLRA
ncbi:MAG TPA: DUF6526 family protein [Vicinamibacterales bacterium]|nr:DUF6526 family protein [Vicinamibacterales bacterium]